MLASLCKLRLWAPLNQVRNLRIFGPSENQRHLTVRHSLRCPNIYKEVRPRLYKFATSPSTPCSASPPLPRHLLGDNGDVARQSRAVEWQINDWGTLTSVGRLGVVVCGAKHHELANGRAVRIRQVLVHLRDCLVELEGLVAAHGRRAQWHLDKLSGREDGGGVGAVGDDINVQVETVGNLGVRVLVHRVVKAGSTEQTLVGGVVVVNHAASVVDLIRADLRGYDDALAHVGDDALRSSVS